tara:strand:+ start:4033 stop:7263 length:3231 start_codon:yes stop_codon:yes gene_type:complete
MAIADVFKVYLYPDPIAILDDFLDPGQTGEDITSGIINVDIVQGTDTYEGPYQQIDTGQFSIVSRNPNLDPKVNTNLKYNSAIAFVDERSGEFFRGYVTNVDVQYQRNDDPLITITGTDIFGVLQRTVVNKDLHDEIIALADSEEWDGLTFQEFVNLNSFVELFTAKYLYLDEIGPANYPVSPGFKFFVASKEGTSGLDTGIVPVTGTLGYSPAKYIPEVGETLLDVINKYATTNFNSVYTKGEFGYLFINVYPFVKYNGYYWTAQQDPKSEFPYYQFSFDPEIGRPYKTILVDNGYKRIINQLDISNEYRTVTPPSDIVSHRDNLGPYKSILSAEDYGFTKASVGTIFPNTDPETLDSMGTTFATNVFQVVGFPSNEIQKITFDNGRYEDIENNFTYSGYVVNDFIRIEHKINSSEFIDRFYDIAGITHSITPDDWSMSFSFKPSQQEIAFNYQGQIPTLEMNSLTGDSNFNFTATITDYPIEDIESVIWDLNQIEPNEETFYYESARSGRKFKDELTRTGLTQTWNFDDDGILAPYSFDSINIPPEDNRYGGYGPGFWWVTAYITLTNGFTIIIQQGLTVGTPVVTANFGWVQNLTNNFGRVTFTDTSVNNETGEEDSYLWDFGDGTTSALQNPVKTYDPAPDETEYEVSVTVFAYGEGGVKVYNTHTETITLLQPTMSPNFTTTQSQQTITFTNTSENVGFEEPDAYLWDFGDGTTSILKNPVHTYGVSENVTTSFSVTLTTRNIWEQTESITNTVTVIAVNTSGTYSVRYIKFRIDPYTKPGEITTSPGDLVAVTPVMSFAKALTSGTNANLMYIKPILNMTDASIPKFGWKNTSGGSPSASLGWEYNLTRDPAITATNAYGLAAGSRNNYGGISVPYATVRWELVVDLGSGTNLINQIIVNFQDFFENGGTFNGLRIEDFYPKISVDVAEVVTDYTPNPAGTFGPPTLNGNWVNIGYIKLDGGRMDPTKPAGQRTSATKTMFAMRPLPLNIPYFTYIFDPFGTNDKQVTFRSVEVADSYLWDFGDGGTSTERIPTYTFASYNTYTVSLEVTNGGTVTRTTTEPVIVQATIT